MPAKSRAPRAALTEGRKVGGATFNQTTLPFGRSPTKTKLKTPENSPDDSPATVKRQRKVQAAKNEELCEETNGVGGDMNGAAGHENGSADKKKKESTGAGAADEYFDEEMDAKSEGKAKGQEENGEKENGTSGRGKRGAAVEKQEPDEPVGKRQKGNSEEAVRGRDEAEKPPLQTTENASENGIDETENGSGKGHEKGGAGKVPQPAKGKKGGKAAKGKKGAKAKAQPAPEPVEDAAVEDEGPALTLEDAVVGKRCKAYDVRDKKSYTAKILKVDKQKGEAFIHYLGWQSKWDQWYAISELKTVKEEKKEVVIPVPQLVVKSLAATSAVLEAVVPENSHTCVAYMVSLDGEESSPFPFPSDTDWTFTQKLPPASTLELRVKLRGRAKKFEVGKWGEWSDAIEVTTPEEEKVEDDGERGAKKAIGDGFYKVSVTESLTEEEKAARAELRAVQFHDSYCAHCFGWEEDDRQLICCDGDCRQSFHASCVNMEEDDIANGEKWLCPGCTAGVLKCLICHCPSPAAEMVRCGMNSCKKTFHAQCLVQEGYAYETDKAFRCSQHACRACSREANLKGFCAKYIKCIRCPDGYHDKCMPSVGHELFPTCVPLRMICAKHQDDMKVLRKLKVQSSLEDDQIDTGPVVIPAHPVFKSLVFKLGEQMPKRFKLPVQYAGARNYEGSKPAPFKLLQRNFYAMGRPKICKEDISICACAPGGEHKCSSLPASMLGKIPQGCGDNCENRLTCVECLASTCRLGAQCGNQRLQKRAYARLDLFKTQGRGFGLKALEKIPAGALVQEYVGEVLAVRDFQARASRYTENTPVYFFNLDNDFVIDASSMGSMARFINHSCGPNCHTEKWTIGNETRIGIFATEDIEAGSEVTYNYQFESFGGTRHKCLCGAPNCSGELGKRPKSAKDLEAEQAALKKKKGKRKKGAVDAPVVEAAEAAPEPAPADPAEQMQGRLVRVVRGKGALLAASEAASAVAGADVEMGEAEAAPADAAFGGEKASGARAEQAEGADPKAGSAAVEGEGETGEVLALEGKLVLVRKAPAEELLRMWRLTSDVLRAREKEKEERERAREAMKEDEEGDVVIKRGEKDALAGLAPVVMDIQVEWVPLADVVTPEQEADVCDEAAEAEGAAVKKEGDRDSELKPSPSKAARGVAERSMRITKVTDERVAEMMSRPVTVVKVQPVDGSLHPRDMAKLCEGLRTHPSLVRLDLDGALIGDEGCSELARVIAQSRTLQAIDLQFNGITDVGAKVLAQAIAEAEATPALRDLHLGRNDITKAAAGELEKALHRSPMLNLLLSGNKLSSAELDQIQQWHLTAGDIRGMLVECDAARRKRSEQRLAALKEEEEAEEEEAEEEEAEKEEAEEVKPAETQGEEGGQVEGGGVVEGGDKPTEAEEVKGQEEGAEAMPLDKDGAAVESAEAEAEQGAGEGSEAVAQKGE